MSNAVTRILQSKAKSSYFANLVLGEDRQELGQRGYRGFAEQDGFGPEHRRHGPRGNLVQSSWLLHCSELCMMAWFRESVKTKDQIDPKHQTLFNL